MNAFILFYLKSKYEGYTYGQGEYKKKLFLQFHLINLSEGYGRHSKEVMYEIGKADLKALDDLIGENKFLLGEEPCETDATVFGNLSQVLFNDRGPFNEYMTSNRSLFD